MPLPRRTDDQANEDLPTGQQVLAELRAIRTQLDAVKVSRWLNLTAALACIACLTAAIAGGVIAMSAKNTAEDSQRQLDLTEQQLTTQIDAGRRAIQVNTQIGCSLGEIVINASQVPRPDETRAEFIGRLQSYGRLLRQLRKVDCQVTPGTRPFEFRRQDSLTQIERILKTMGAPIEPAAETGQSESDPVAQGPAGQTPDPPAKPTPPGQDPPPAPDPEPPVVDPDPEPPAPAPEPVRPGLGDAVRGAGDAVDEITAPICGTVPLAIVCAQ